MFKRLSDLSDPTVTVNIESEEVQVPADETVAAAVLVHGLGYTRTTPLSGAPRAPLCMMGVCFECLMEIDGVPNRQACQVQVAEGMKICRQRGVGGEDA
ncbi:MAG: (2Fe-2S)-binding protein [Cyanobacteria bacterium P01_D01_bin.44]